MSLATPITVEKLRKALHVKAKEEVEHASTNWRQRRANPAVVGAPTPCRSASAPPVVVSETQERRQGDPPLPRRVSASADGTRPPDGDDARPSVGEGMIPERAGCGKSARPVRRAATGNGAGINRIMPARHRASRRLYPRAAMIAQDFARVRVLASGSIAAAYGGAEHVRARGQKCPTGYACGPTPPCEGAAAQSVLARISKTARTSLKCNDLR